MIQFGAILVPAAIATQHEMDFSQVLAESGSDCNYTGSSDEQNVPHHRFEGRDTHVAGLLAEKEIPFISLWPKDGNSEALNNTTIDKALNALTMANAKVLT